MLSVALSPDGKNTLAIGSEDDTARLWDVNTGQLIATLSGHPGPVDRVAFSPDSNTLASNSTNHTLWLWDINAGQRKAIIMGHTDSVRSVAFSPDGNILATGSEGRYGTALGCQHWTTNCHDYWPYRYGS